MLDGMQPKHHADISIAITNISNERIIFDRNVSFWSIATAVADAPAAICPSVASSCFSASTVVVSVEAVAFNFSSLVLKTLVKIETIPDTIGVSSGI